MNQFCCCSNGNERNEMDKYEKIKEIIESHSGEIWHVKHKATQKEYAMKIFPKTESSKSEIDIHSRLNHPNIVQYHEHFADDAYYYMVLEYCPAGDLFEVFLKNESKTNLPLSERQVVIIAKQIASALSYLHSQQIMFGDLKPENILLSNEKTLEIKLCDFGMSSGKPLTKICGTLLSLAPEILLGKPHYIASDLWTFGFLVCELIIQSDPVRITPKSYQEHQHNFKNHSVNTPFLIDFSKMMSVDAYDFVMSLIKFDPNERMSISDCLKHRFLCEII